MQFADMQFERDSFMQKRQRILRSRCTVDGVQRSLQVPVRSGENEEKLYTFLEKRLYAATLPPAERAAFLTSS